MMKNRVLGQESIEISSISLHINRSYRSRAEHSENQNRLRMIFAEYFYIDLISNEYHRN